jgi:acylphosphatase
MKTSGARRFLISGRVQGVGFRNFAERAARQTGVSGWTRNLDDGRVEVHANGPRQALDNFESLLRTGPRFADVRGFESTEAAIENSSGFEIR